MRKLSRVFQKLIALPETTPKVLRLSLRVRVPCLPPSPMMRFTVRTRSCAPLLAGYMGAPGPFELLILGSLCLAFIVVPIGVVFGVLVWSRRRNADLPQCPDCGRRVSPVAESCPGCGRPLKALGG